MKPLSFYDLCELTKGSFQELGIHSHTIQQVCRRFSQSRSQYRKCPKFRRSKGGCRSLGWIPFTTRTRVVTPSSVSYLGRAYSFCGAGLRPLPPMAKGGCFAEDARGRWYVCFQVGIIPDDYHGFREQGLDLGLKDLVATSEGVKYENPAFLRKS